MGTPKRTGRPTEQEGHVDATINGRITIEQIEYLRQLSDDLGLTLSGALRKAIDQSRLFDVASGRTPVYDEDGNEQAGASAFVLGASTIDELGTEGDPS